ncbi:MAG TPA: hypothetical protein VN806_08535 [Caulobacteraceae bacterium]|nr:hypothetical protein [Caulobacteraceae bacterium]
MSELDSIRDVIPYPGLRYAKRVMVVDAANEARLMGHCGIDPAVFGGGIDPAAHRRPTRMVQSRRVLRADREMLIRVPVQFIA